MARTKPNTHNSTKHTEHQDATDIQNKLFLCFSDFSIFICDVLYESFWEMLSYRLCTVNDFNQRTRKHLRLYLLPSVNAIQTEIVL